MTMEELEKVGEMLAPIIGEVGQGEGGVLAPIIGEVGQGGEGEGGGAGTHRRRGGAGG